MLDRAEEDPAFAGDETVCARWGNDPLPRTVGMRPQAAFVHAFGDEAADGRVHTVGLTEKQPVVCRDDRMEPRQIGSTGVRIFQRILERGQSGIPGMETLHRLFELHLVTEKHEVLCASRHRDGIGKGNLAGFIDE